MHDTAETSGGRPRARMLPDSAAGAVEVLLDPALEATVEMVLLAEGDTYEAVAPDGRVRLRRRDPDGDGHRRVEVVAVEGRDPLGDQAVDRFAGLEAERSARHPHRTANSYPHGYEQVAQLFDHPAAPDMVVVHSSSHHHPESGGYLGEHGSLDVVQARAPFVVAGRGVRRHGMVDDSARLVDVAPTVAALLGVAPHHDGALVAGTDGTVRDDLLDQAQQPRHVVGFLFDGTNPNVLYDLAERGEAPNVTRLIGEGSALRYGAFAGLPTVTLANHTSILTGRTPGHHGVLHNAWYDRATAASVDTNSLGTWPWAMQHLVAGVETLHEAIHRTWPDAVTAAVNEPCDRGADYSTFDFFRSGEVPEVASSPEGMPFVNQELAEASLGYSAFSIVDHMALEQAVGVWQGSYRGVSYPPPRFMWVNFALTDTAMHEGGPHSEMAAAAVRDTDARLGAVLDAVERAGALDDTAFVLVADHGMEETDPEVRGDWNAALHDAGIRCRNEAAGFLYLDEEPR